MLSLFSSKVFANSEQCLAKAMYYEANGGKDSELLNVGHVVLNRVKNNKFPNSVCSVIADKKHTIQFPWYYQSKRGLDGKSYENIKVLAKKLYSEFVNDTRRDTTNGSLFFHSKRINPKWRYQRVSVNDSLHSFYKLGR